ncbi:MAG: fumarylacetoacetate hydrolase family protein [Hyphomonadaceae bacterium]
MTLIRFQSKSGPRLAWRIGEEAIDLSIAAPGSPNDAGDWLRAGLTFDAARQAAQRAGAEARMPLSDLQFLPPTANPGKIICLGVNYVDHAAEGGMAKPDFPVIFYRAATTFVAHGQPIVRPRVSDKLDYEGELAAIIGEKARHVPRARAHEIVAGYSIFNDGSIRDYQRRTAQWTIGKNFDGTGGFGPGFVPAAALPPGAKGLKLQTRLNGQVMQEANTADMVFDIAETIAILTECMTLEPGDVLVMGTPAGVGAARNPPVFMKPGDVCEIEIEGIGILRNPIVQEN